MENFNGIMSLIQGIFFLIYAYFQYMLSKKLEIQYSWMAWIPVLNYFNQLSIAGKNISWWFKWFVIPFIIIIVAALIGDITQSMAIPSIIIAIASIITLVIGIIKMMHGISKRTGHGAWWTAGLIFAGWIFLPVTALHYEKGDETNPRPFIGWRKVLLVLCALGLPFAILGLIIASISASMMTGYLDKSRDAARMSHLKIVSTTLGAYYTDRERYPATPDSGCVSSDMFPAEYIYGTQGFNDPIPTNITPGCDGTDGTYAYRSITTQNGNPGYVLGAKMEDKRGGNSSLLIDEITSDDQLIRGSGPYYYIVQ